ncbi:MAG: family 20 glycosylhydrolase [Prevotella shahii]|jgi:beta-L-N-acetylhexosaminidase|uniref:glycoside hydrolase family 20 protein n=1 Tax=Hoylesella shahii TaxID=228603 RepID=UPI001CB2F60D|nr:family 20 glycosylhydrolase [Hoylesella shahii]MBF1576245.1 family 20 glycosylhydrolase [Hoylesella shahii]MBF1590538.1 family 20 glycosylhydrolase [Hoylesella shahii]
MYLKQIFLGALGLLFATFAQAQAPKTTANYRVVPLPQEISNTSAGAFALNAQTRIAYPKGNAALQKDAELLAQYLFEATKVRPTLTTNAQGRNLIVLSATLKNNNKEAYRLDVSKDRISINGASAAGTFYGIQTLRKAIPQTGAQKLFFPSVTINDQPRFGYRGAMLDVARHFFSFEEVKTFIDILALHNINRFHWHLTDDQGWRIEIKKYPRLTEVSSMRPETMVGHDASKFDGKPHGGFYTQEQARAIVKYAADRHIMVVPEIDMPGHMVAALAAYPELGCTGGPYKVRTTWGVAEDVLCAGNERTLKFAKEVLSEVMNIFPGEYLYIGGDECPKSSWEKCSRCQALIKEKGLATDEKHTAEERLQSYFMSDIANFITAHGRKVGGWDEILEGGIAPNATVLSWRGMEGGIEAARLGHDAIMCPVSHLYLDYYQTADRESEPTAFNGFIPIERTYDFNPVSPQLTANEAKHIIGVQANVWTEYMKTFKQVEYMTLPRLAAASEVQWTMPEKKNFDDFANRMPQLLNVYNLNKYNYGRHLFNVNIDVTAADKPGSINITLTARKGATIYYTLDGSKPTTKSNRYTQTFTVNKSCKLRTIAVYPSFTSGENTEDLLISKATMANVKYNVEPNNKYPGLSPRELTNGLQGNVIFNSGRWVGYEGKDLDLTIDLGEVKPIRLISVRTLVSPSQWIMPHRGIWMWVSTDGKNFEDIYDLPAEPMPANKPDYIDTDNVLLPMPKDARYVRIKMLSEKSMPAWHPNAGKTAWLFVDEITVE